MKKINLDDNYLEILKDEDIYSDMLDFYLDKISKALNNNEISKKEAALIMGIILRKIFKEDIHDTMHTLIGKRQKIKNTLFIQSSNKVEQYV